MSKIVAEDETERRILNSDEFLTGCKYVSHGAGHKEKEVGVHIKQILDFIDRQPWQRLRVQLRRLALLHDLGKVKVLRNEKGGIVGLSHSQHSEEIARQFIEDPEVLYCIRIHDKYFQFFRAAQAERFDRERFRNVYTPANLDMLIRFNYADSGNRERKPVIWFEDECYDMGLRSTRVYETEPSVLD